jgi:hypothetical protein
VATPADPGSEERWGPEDAAPFVHATQERPGSMPPDADPGTAAAPGMSEELEPIDGLHQPDVDERADRES